MKWLLNFYLPVLIRWQKIFRDTVLVTPWLVLDLQFEYDSISRKINCMWLGDARISNKTYADKRMKNINAGELIIRDLGYNGIIKS